MGLFKSGACLILWPMVGVANGTSKKRGSRKILTGSRNLGSVFDKSRSLVFAWFVFTFFESRNFLPKSLGLGFLTRVLASQRVSDFTICHPLWWTTFLGIRLPGCYRYK